MHGGLSQFKAAQQRRKERSESRDKGGFERKPNRSVSDKIATDFNFPKMSEAEFEEFKAKLIKKRKQKERRVIIFVSIGLLIATLLLFLALN